MICLKYQTKKICRLQYSVLRLTSRSYQLDVMQIREMPYSLRYTNTNVQLFYRKTTYGLKYFRFKLIKIWNSLPMSFRNINTFHQFKSNIIVGMEIILIAALVAKYPKQV